MLKTGLLSKILILFILTLSEPVPASQQTIDTSSINIRTRNAFINARTNPDMVIPAAHQALNESRTIAYNKGIADASLALGFAYFAKYMSDSALFYNMQAYDLYIELKDLSGKARACYGLSYVYSMKSDLSESERYAALALNFFDQNGDTRGMVNSYSALSYLAKQQNDLRKAGGLIRQAVEVARSVNDTLPLADALNSLGNIYKDMTLFSQAIDTYFEALNLWELKGDSNGISIAYGSIGLMYFYQKEWNQALEFNFKKLPLSLAAGNLWEASKTYNTIAQIYNSTNKHDTALIYLRRSLQLNERMNYPSGIADSYHNIATTYLLTEETDSAFLYIQKAIDIARGLEENAIVNYQITLGHIYRAQNNYTPALQSALTAYNMAKEYSLPLLRYESSSLLSDLYSQLGRKEIAYDYLREFHQLQDSISNDEFLRQVTRMELEYDFDKRQREAEYARDRERMLAENRIRQQKAYLIGLAVLVVIGTLFTLLYLRHNRLRNLYSRIDLEQRLLRAQMNPHFIFNSLCAVQDFILGDKSEKANTFLIKISRLMRNILENSREEFIPLEKEIETIRLYLEVQQLRFETEFEYKIEIDETIDTENISIPPMLTQPCIENSIEHGLLPLKKKGMIIISFNIIDGVMKLEVTDNGVGREEAAAKENNNGKKRSISTKLTNERIEHFRKQLKEKSISYQISDLYENEKAAGTKVIMMLPYKKLYA